MKIFFDTNVLLDLLLKRPGYQNAQKILEYASADEWSRVYLSYLSVADAAYVLRKISIQDLYKHIRQIVKIFNVLPCNDIQIIAAEKVNSPDYEDSLQIACAEQARCNVIITGNKSHFASVSSIPVTTPEEFVSMFAE